MRRLHVFLVTSCALLLACTVGAAQFASGVNLVEVYASVIDARGNAVMGLTMQDFRVEEDGEPEVVSTFAGGNVPLSVAVAVDHSFSLSRERLQAATMAARDFIAQLRPDDRVMVMAIGSQTETVVPLTADHAAASAALVRLEPWGTTPLYDATVEAVDAIGMGRGRRALIILSDGSDRYSRVTAAEALDHVRRMDVLVYPVALGKQRVPVFAELATVTGGRSFAAADQRALQEALGAIASELRFQYLLGYTPARQERGAGWRSIHVTVNRPNVRVRARDGYFAK